MLQQLLHRGVIVPEPPEYQGLSIKIDGVSMKLNPTQEEMAYAWAKKKGTPYVEDLVFIRNFMLDFSATLGYEKPLKINQIDFGELDDRVAREKAEREALSKEDKKELARERKERRDQLKEMYGYALADGERIELGNYMTEPSGIFMGRGKHPLRGRWKRGATKKDVTLNLSPDAEIDRSEWKEVIWQPESLWVARWEDKLSGKQKYVWLHDSAPIKQSREAQKFDKAIELDEKLPLVRDHIERGLLHENAKVRRIATACSLIDKLCLRVGDEKDPDEADTVGATTLRPEHVKIHAAGVVEFRFLGKDSVLWHKKITLPERVIANLHELLQNAKPSAAGKKNSTYNKPQLFPDVSSRDVNAFLAHAMPGLTAKVFRTHHASEVVRDSLDAAGIARQDPEYKKWEAATQANTQAAILCNHTKQAPKNWSERKKRYKEREKRAAENVKKVQDLARELKSSLSRIRQEYAAMKKTVSDRAQAKKMSERYTKRINALKERIDHTRDREEKAHQALGKLRAQMAIAMENRTWNLGTSQKSYIDPRIFYSWGCEVDYDVLEKYYSKTLRVKFQWVKKGELNDGAAE
ncbi:DNA topoisomerase I [candidate division KSB1 bacterium]|nr:DNA topoisomerase I [candidate division KSB1 bacterium]